MTRIMQHGIAAVVAILITAATFTEAATVPTDTTAPAPAALVA